MKPVTQEHGAIISTNWEGLQHILLDEFGAPVRVGRKVGSGSRVTGGSAPHKPSSCGRIRIENPASFCALEEFPTNYGFKWVLFVSTAWEKVPA